MDFIKVSCILGKLVFLRFYIKKIKKNKFGNKRKKIATEKIKELFEKKNIPGKQLDTIMHPHTIVNLDKIFYGRYLENFNNKK